MNTNPIDHRIAQPRTPRPSSSNDVASLFGEYAALAQHPGEEDDRLALAIRVFEALRLGDTRPS